MSNDETQRLAAGSCPWFASGNSIANVRKSQAAHGVSVLEARKVSGKWTVVKNSPYGRCISANTPCAVSGPAADHALLKANEHIKQESAQYAVDSGNSVAFYMVDDEKNEYIYKFVCAGHAGRRWRGAARQRQLRWCQ